MTQSAVPFEFFIRLFDAVSRTDPPDAVIGLLCRDLASALRIDHAAVLLLNKQPIGRLVQDREGGSSAEVVVFNGEAAALESFAGSPIILSESPEIAAWLRQVLPGLTADSVQQVLLLRIGSQSHSAAFLALQTSDPARQFGEDEINICRIVAGILAAPTETLLRRGSPSALDAGTGAAVLFGIKSREQLYRAMVHQAMKLVSTPGGGFYLNQPSATVLKLFVADDNRRHLEGREVKLGEGMAGQLIQLGSRAPIQCENYAAYPNRASTFDNDRPFGSVLAIAVWLGEDTLYGVLFVDDVAGRRFSREEEEAFQTFALRIRPVLESVETHEKLSRINVEQALRMDLERVLLTAGTNLHALCVALSDFVRSESRAHACRVITMGPPIRVAGSSCDSGLNSHFQIEYRNVPDTHAHTASASMSSSFSSMVVMDASETIAFYPSEPGLSPDRQLVLLALDDSSPESRGKAFLEILLPGLVDDRFRSLAAIVSAQAGPFLYRTWRQAEQQHRTDSVSEFVRAAKSLRSDHSPDRIVTDLARLTRDLAGAAHCLVFTSAFGSERLRFVDGTKALVHKEVPSTTTLAASFRTGILSARALNNDDRAIAEESVDFQICVPVKGPQGATHILWLWYEDRSSAPGKEMRELLEYLASSAATVLHASTLVHDAQFGETHHLAYTFARFAPFLLQTPDRNKIIDAILTLATANFGLCFNRAALYMLNHSATMLNFIGAIGPTNFSEAKASWRAWEVSGKNTVDGYLGWIRQNPPAENPLGRILSSQHLSVSYGGRDPFSTVLFQSVEPLRIEEPNEDRCGLPIEFREAFVPRRPFVIAPITAGRKIGVLVADSAFTGHAVGYNDKNSLRLLCDIAGSALKRVVDDQASRGGLEDIEAIYGASALEQIERRLLAELQRESCADGAVLHFVDEGRIIIQLKAGSLESARFCAVQIPEGCVMQRAIDIRYPVSVHSSDIGFQRSSQIGADHSFKSHIFVPLFAHDNCIGVLWLGYSRRTEPDDALLARLEHHAAFAGLIYDEKRTLLAEERLTQSLSRLAEVSGLKETAQTAATEAKRVFDAFKVTLWFYHSASNSFRESVSGFAGWEDAEPREPKNYGITADVLFTRGYTRREECALCPETSCAVNYGIGSFQAIPVLAAGERMGVLYVSYSSPRAFTEADRVLMQRYSAFAGVALKRAQQSTQLEKVKNAARVIAELIPSANLQRCLDDIAERVRQALECTSVCLFSYNPDRAGFEYPPGVSDGVLDRVKTKEAPELPAGSIVRNLIKRDEPYIAHDATTDPLLKDRRFTREERVRSCMVLPLTLPATKELVGLLFVNYSEPQAFSPAQKSDIEFFAAPAAVACRYAQITNLKHTLQSQQQVTTEVSQELLRLSRLDQASELILNTATKEMNVEYGALALKRRDVLQFFKVFRWPAHFDGTEVPATSHAAASVLQNRCIVASDETFAPTSEKDSLTFGQGMVSTISVPIPGTGGPIGALILHSRSQRHFSDLDQSFLSALAAQSAATIARIQQTEYKGGEGGEEGGKFKSSSSGL